MENISTAYLSAEGYVDRLTSELEGVVAVHDRLVFTDHPLQSVYWAQNVWLNPIIVNINSISDAARQLKAIQSSWILYPVGLHRRAAFIEEKLPRISSPVLTFPDSPPRSPLGSWTLLEQNLLVASSQCTSPFPNGEIFFEEDKEGPPSRAYLKLWEAWTLMAERPKEGEFCIDAGGSPGGWCWAMQQLGAQVLSVDRSPLDKKVGRLPGVEFKKGSAFALQPEDFDCVDWLCSDVICYPEKLYDWALRWVESGVCKKMICTIKFQGEYDSQIVKRFASIPSSRVVHLFNNKNELTWMWSGEPPEATD